MPIQSDTCVLLAGALATQAKMRNCPRLISGRTAPFSPARRKLRASSCPSRSFLERAHDLISLLNICMMQRIYVAATPGVNAEFVSFCIFENTGRGAAWIGLRAGGPAFPLARARGPGRQRGMRAGFPLFSSSSFPCCGSCWRRPPACCLPWQFLADSFQHQAELSKFGLHLAQGPPDLAGALFDGQGAETHVQAVKESLQGGGTGHGDAKLLLQLLEKPRGAKDLGVQGFGRKEQHGKVGGGRRGDGNFSRMVRASDFTRARSCLRASSTPAGSAASVASCRRRKSSTGNLASTGMSTSSPPRPGMRMAYSTGSLLPGLVGLFR